MKRCALRMRVVLVGIVSIAIAGGAVAWIAGLDVSSKGLWSSSGSSKVESASSNSPNVSAPATNTKVEVFPDPNALGCQPTYSSIRAPLMAT